VGTGYVDKWDEMERIYEEELPSGKYPKLYAIMWACEFKVVTK